MHLLNLLQREGGTQKGEVPSERGGGGSNPGGNYDLLAQINAQEWTFPLRISLINWTYPQKTADLLTFIK